MGAAPSPCDWFVLGEGSRQDEDRRGKPFVGKTGQEMRRYFDGVDLPDFDRGVFRSNVYRYYGGKDYEYTAEDFVRDEPDLIDEFQQVQPKVVVAVGRYAARYCLGDITLDETHGLPWRAPESLLGSSCEPPVVFVTYHPAAGFRSPEASALVSYDFKQLALYAAGKIEPRALYDDPIPEPRYEELSLRDEIWGEMDVGDTLAIDSEGYPHAPWSLQFTVEPGTGFVMRDLAIDSFLCHLVVNRPMTIYHSALHDRAMLRVFARRARWSEERILFELDTLPFDDTMIMAYLLQLEPQGLKALAVRHCGMKMQSYDEVLGDARSRLATDYAISIYDCCQFDYEIDQQQEFERINKTPLRNKDGSVKRLKADGSIRYRHTTTLPKLPKSRLFKAVERLLRAKDPWRLWHNQEEDIQDAGYRLLGAMPEGSLSHVPPKKAKRYACRDTDATTRVLPELSKRIDAMGLRETYNLEVDTYPIIDRMAAVGIKPDLNIFSALGEKLTYHLADLQVQLETETGVEDFNAGSYLQVSHLLFDQLGLPPIKKTSTGVWSTNDKILEALEKEHGHECPVISSIRETREVSKLKNTFVDRMPDFVRRYPHDGRIHTTFRTTRVITGRLSASDPNLLAQPEHGKFAKDFKAGWVAEDGHVLYNIDLSQIELRVLAHLSRDPVLLASYRDGLDLHARLAQRIFGGHEDDYKKGRGPTERLAAKAVNFGIPMGMTCHGLMIELRKNGVETDERGAQEWIDATNELYKQVPIYKAEKIAEARRLGHVRCLSGRIRYIGGIRSWDDRLKSEAERFAFSTPIQEGAQWLMKQAESVIWSDILMPYYKDGWFKGGSKGRWVEPLMQVHDALKFEVAEDLQWELHKKVKQAMIESPTQLIVPLDAEGEWGHNFRDMEGF